MFKSGVLVLSLPLASATKISSYLKNASGLVKNVLYIKLEPNIALIKSKLSSSQSRLPTDCWSPKTDLVKIVPNIYRIASQTAPSLDVRVLLSSSLKLNFQPEVLMTDSKDVEVDLWKKYAGTVLELQSLNEVRYLEDFDQQVEENVQECRETVSLYNHCCLGGTFDGLHNGHKVLLNEAILRCQKSLTIGVTDIEMIKSKLLWELIKSVDVRINDLRRYLLDIDATIDYKIVPIKDPFGPAIEDPSLECLVVSEETLRGGQKINEMREQKHMKKVELVVVKLLNESEKSNNLEENKISSSNARLRRLGTLIREPEIKPHLQPKPYLIGVTGGIASGKSNICKVLGSLGAGLIDCDKLAHLSYMSPGSIAHEAVRKEFGDQILNPDDKNVDRLKLSQIVFKNKDKLQSLNKIVWPATEILVQEKIAELKKSHSIIVLEVALLLESNWDRNVHQVWVSIIPPEEAVKRLKHRNNMNEEDAKRRIQSQLTNYERVQKANVVFCSLWDYEYTRSQVERAWKMVQAYAK